MKTKIDPCLSSIDELKAVLGLGVCDFRLTSKVEHGGVIYVYYVSSPFPFFDAVNVKQNGGSSALLLHLVLVLIGSDGM